ncbi:hypothetical protein GA565_14145 [Rouxiella sp. S1S-2]|uniref:hypothetical protein n=1 Tax=Rouxiella sp. S1S-2 TaxID=2653856 RepID=UPI0012651B45|nr:hypothetical protein [Rouxiella sp. S1S-2]KAB7897034.1 hypothetical protein GA565_14145 [Rouxiella sp. S1S-2]
MSNINNENVSVLADVAVAETDISKNDLDYLKAIQNHSMMGGAMVTMEEMMLMFTELAQGKFKQMQDKTSVGRDATDMANRVEGIIAKLKNGDAVVQLPSDVIAYMKKNNIQIGGKSVDDYLYNATTVGSTKINIIVAQNAVKSAVAKLENAKTPEDIANAKTGLKAAEAGLISALSKVNFNKAELEEVKGALESTATRATDFVQSSQLKLQQLMQSFNTAVAMANAVQSMNGESTKSIAQSIR